MRFLETNVVIGTALLLLATAAEAKHGHGISRLEEIQRRHTHHKKHAHTTSPVEDSTLTALSSAVEQGLHQEVKRGQCQFPSDAGLVAVTPGSSNAGWAMSPDQPCKPGGWCPYACPPGQVSMQWDPSVTSYTYPGSMNGGLYCNSDGTISKPIPSNPYCKDGTGSVSVVNNLNGVHSVCQTVLPGNEAMLIATEVASGSSKTIAVPGTDYWCSTAAHYYHNGPGVSAGAGCIWGDGSQPIGNWSPYVSGANTDANGNTFVKIAWNPIYTGESTFRNDNPSWGIKIECPNGGCNGLPCSIDPSVNSVNGVTSSLSATGAGGGNFCVVTVSKGSSANIVVFNAGQSGSSAQKPSSSAAAAPPSTTPSPTPTPTPTPTIISTTTTTSTTPSTTTTTTKPSTTTTTTSSTSSIISSSSAKSSNTTSASPTISNAPHVFFENDTSISTSSGSSKASTTSGPVSLTNVAPAAATSSQSAAAKMVGVGRDNSAFAMVILGAVAIGLLL